MVGQPGTHAFTLESGAFQRHYLAHLPRTSGQKAWPVVLMLHGAGASPRWTLDETGWDQTADREGFLLVVPEGLPLDPTRPASFKHNPPFWNDGSPRARSAPRQVDDVTFLGDVVRDLGRHFPLDRDHLYLTGFSNGAAMSFRLAAELSFPVAAIAPVAGHCWIDRPHLARPVSTLYLVGTEDPLYPSRAERSGPCGGGRSIAHPSARRCACGARPLVAARLRRHRTNRVSKRSGFPRQNKGPHSSPTSSRGWATTGPAAGDCCRGACSDPPRTASGPTT